MLNLWNSSVSLIYYNYWEGTFCIIYSFFRLCSLAVCYTDNIMDNGMLIASFGYNSYNFQTNLNDKIV